MSAYLSLTPVDWSRFEALSNALEGDNPGEALTSKMAAMHYWLDDDDRAFVESLKESALLANAPIAMLVQTRIDPATHAAHAAELVHGAGEDRPAFLAELTRMDGDYPFEFDPTLLLGRFSRAYTGYLVGEAEAEGAVAPYDGPQVLSQALGGTVAADYPTASMLAPAQVKAISAALESFDEATALATTDPRLLDFYEDNAMSNAPLDTVIVEALDLLRFYFRDATGTGCGLFVHSTG